MFNIIPPTSFGSDFGDNLDPTIIMEKPNGMDQMAGWAKITAGQPASLGPNNVNETAAVAVIEPTSIPIIAP